MDMSSQPQLSQSGELTSDDLQEVFEALYSIAPGKVINFGLKLKVSRNVIQSFELRCADIYDILREILHARLNQLPPLTWHDIVRILQSPTVQQHDLARTIESQYITASQSPASVSQQASAESSHAAIHTSGAQPSTHAPPQPPLHTVAATSVALTHTLPQPSFYNMGQLPHPSFPNQPSMVPNSVAPYPAYNFHLPFYQLQPQVLPQYSVPASTVSHSVSASSQLICGPSSGVVASGVNASHAGVEYSSTVSRSCSPQIPHNASSMQPPTMQHHAHLMPSYSGQDSYPYGYPPHMFMYTNQPNQTPPYPAPIPSFPYLPPNQHNLQPVQPNSQSSRGQ